MEPLMSGPLAHLDYHLLTVFTLSAVVTIWSVVVVSGFLPLDVAPSLSRGKTGAALVGLSTVAIAVVAASLFYLATLQPWAVSIIAAGIAILAAPFLVEILPRGFRESKAALGTVLALCALMLPLVTSVFAL